ncbi:MAG: AAA family ATPase [Flavobacteriales bacterium]|nr:AAA family ATPase [Flavobacteriales bacterium]
MIDKNVLIAEKFIKSYDDLFKEITKIIIGQDKVVKDVLSCIFSGGHCLIVGVPGLAKTLMVKTVSECLSLDFKRIQFTPDLIPSDIIGAEILDNNKNLIFRKGPIFSNIILADEINRTSPKTQSALLEAMQEKSVTVSGQKYKLSKPFFVLATQNPIEQEGTYPLPEAQLDRFMFNVIVDYPLYDDEVSIIKKTTSFDNSSVKQVISNEELLSYQDLISKIPVPDNVYKYAVDIAVRTRPNTKYATEYVKNYINWGAGPRASQYLIIAAKCDALVNGKFSPDIENVQNVVFNVLRHRLVKNYKADAEGITLDNIISNLL